MVGYWADQSELSPFAGVKGSTIAGFIVETGNLSNLNPVSNGFLLRTFPSNFTVQTDGWAKKSS